MASAAVRIKAVVQSLFVVAPIVCGGLVFGLCFVLQYFVLCPFWFCNHLVGKERVGCFTFLCSECHVAVIVL